MQGVTIPQGGVVPHINPELLKKRKGGKLVPIPEPRTKIAKSPKKKGAAKEVASPTKKAGGKKAAPNKTGSPSKKAQASKKKSGAVAGEGVTVLSEKTLFLGQKVHMLCLVDCIVFSGFGELRLRYGYLPNGFTKEQVM